MHRSPKQFVTTSRSILTLEMYAAFVNQLRTTLLCLSHSVVLIVSPIWAGSFRTQGQDFQCNDSLNGAVSIME